MQQNRQNSRQNRHKFGIFQELGSTLKKGAKYQEKPNPKYHNSVNPRE